MGQIRKKRLKSLPSCSHFYTLFLFYSEKSSSASHCDFYCVFMEQSRRCKLVEESLLPLSGGGKNIPLHIFQCSCYISHLESNKK